ncbi:unnamed protein product, partial [Pleuronectes platessa]
MARPANTISVASEQEYPAPMPTRTISCVHNLAVCGAQCSMLADISNLPPRQAGAIPLLRCTSSKR